MNCLLSKFLYLPLSITCVKCSSMLPFAALVCGFEAYINDKHVVGVVKEKEQAHREYKEAVSKGHGAYLMDEETPVCLDNK